MRICGAYVAVAANRAHIGIRRLFHVALHAVVVDAVTKASRLLLHVHRVVAGNAEVLGAAGTAVAN